MCLRTCEQGELLLHLLPAPPPPPALPPRLLSSGAGGVDSFQKSSRIPRRPKTLNKGKLNKKKRRRKPDDDMHVNALAPAWKRRARRRPLQLLSVTTARCSQPFEPERSAGDSAAVCYCSNQTGRPSRNTGATRTHTQNKRAHTHTHMALGEIVRTTWTSQGSPPPSPP